MTQTNKAPLLSKLGLGFFIIGLLCLVAKSFTPEWIDASGMLHEPYFFMIPIGFSSVFLGLILGSVAFIKNMTGLKK